MTLLSQLLTDLREKRLWPLAVLLLVALVAAPVVLSNSSSAPAPAPVPQAAAGTPPTGGIPAVSVDTQPVHSRLTGRARDPFRQQKLSAAKTVSSTPAAGTSTTTGTTPSTSTTGATTTATGGSSSGTSPATPPPATIPITKHKPAPAGLTATESYRVAVAMTNASGGIDTIDPVQRLSILPSAQQPLLIELGVLQGGRRVLFLVQPGTLVSGPGTCIPGPVDCEILSLAPGEIENVGHQASTGAVLVGQFAVTDISVDHHPSASVADQARRHESAAGRLLVSRSTLTTLSLFLYDPSLGAVVDQRNLTVGGN